MQRNINLATLFILGALPLGALAVESAPPADSPMIKDIPSAATPATPAPKADPAPLFQQLDTNHDGYVSKEEAQRSAEVTARFAELDTNRDGKISVAEFNRGMRASL